MEKEKKIDNVDLLSIERIPKTLDGCTKEIIDFVNNYVDLDRINQDDVKRYQATLILLGMCSALIRQKFPENKE